ncbi:MAG: APA family basic amino acid/polyamine antiporter [Alphaproteobacteria bacterium]|jgi:APA family basic amino acid/polyamine antiporter
MAAPSAILRVRDGVALMVGMVVGIGVFKAPSLVALKLGDPLLILGLWAAGAILVMIGALCYAELASAYPDAGGEVHFLTRAFGPGTAFLFAWGRLAVVQTGAIAAVAFVFGDYAQRLVPLGAVGPSLYAALAVVGLGWLNITGARLSARVQSGLAAVLIVAVLAMAVLGFVLGPTIPAPASGAAPGSGDVLAGIGFAMIFVMLTYGGWNEAAYLSAELKDVKHAMVRMVMIATAIVTILYLALNAAYLHVLGATAMGASSAIGADYMRALLGPSGAALLSLIVIIAAATTMNATIFTGARSAYAMGRDSGIFAGLGRWDAGAQGPVNAHLVQGAIALGLIALGTVTRQGFTTMVEYTAPVFWFFLMLTGVALFVLRRKGQAPVSSFRVPLYPLTPLVFCASSAFMLHASVAYTGAGGLIGVSVLALGLPLWWFVRRRPVPLPEVAG